MAVFSDVRPFTDVSEMLTALGIRSLVMETVSTAETSENFYTAKHSKTQSPFAVKGQRREYKPIPSCEHKQLILYNVCCLKCSYCVMNFSFICSDAL